jgi:hypothetical protein
MKILAFAVAIGSISLADAGELGSGKAYKADIQDFITLRVTSIHPEYGRLFFGFSKPARVLFGDKKQKRTAVRCDWSASLRNGDPLLMIVREIFLIDEGFVYEVSTKERIEWVDGEPEIDRDQPNRSTDPTLASVTPPAGHEPSLR